MGLDDEPTDQAIVATDRLEVFPSRRMRENANAM